MVAVALGPPPGGGFVTVIGIVPARCSSDAGMVIVIEVAELYAAARGVVPLAAVVFCANPVPVNVTVASDVPGDCICRGEIAESFGSALVMENDPGPAADPPPGAGFVTPIGKFPDACKKFAVTCPVSDVDEISVVGIGVPPNVIVEPGPKLDPET
jgi:hypothetical protein